MFLTCLPSPVSLCYLWAFRGGEGIDEYCREVRYFKVTEHFLKLTTNIYTHMESEIFLQISRKFPRDVKLGDFRNSSQCQYKIHTLF